jgi:hypothetical protein
VNIEAAERLNNYRGFAEYRLLDKRELTWLFAQIDILDRDVSILQAREDIAEARIRELREAFVAGFEHCESVGRGYTSAKLEAEALRRYPKSEEGIKP